MQLDMTKGTPRTLILRFLFPLIIGNIFQQFYNMTDTIIVGRFIGKNALAAVGSTGTIMFLLLGFFQGITAGFSIPVAQNFGAKRIEQLKKSVGNAIILALFLILIGTLCSVSLIPSILSIMHTPADIFLDAKHYISTVCIGLCCIIIYDLCANLLRAVGNSKTPLYFLILSAGLNIILDFILILLFPMGVSGAALATVISQGVSGLLCIFYIAWKVPILHVKCRHLRLDRTISKQQLSLGIPMSLQYSITAIGTMIVQSSLNLLGTTAVAAYTAANKIENVVTQPFPSMGVTLANYCAQNRGIHAFSRIKKGVKSGFCMSTIYAIFAGVGISFALPYLLPIFIAEDFSAILHFARIFIFLDALFFIPLGYIFVFRESLQGSGYALPAMMAGVVELSSRSIIAKIASDTQSFAWVCLANGITWLVTAIFIGIVFFILMRKHSDL